MLRRELPGAAGSAGRGVLVHAASPLLEALAGWLAEAVADELLFYDSTSFFCSRDATESEELVLKSASLPH